MHPDEFAPTASADRDRERFRGGLAAGPSMPAILLRGASQLAEFNLQAARTLLRTHAQAAAAFGLPDWSPLLEGSEDRGRRVLSSGVDQMLDTVQRANETAAEIQRQVKRVLETQSSQATDVWQRSLEQVGSQASDAMTRISEVARSAAEEITGYGAGSCQ